MGIFTAIIGMFAPIGNAISSIFNYKTKTALTPEQNEIQQVRKERDETDKAIDDLIDGRITIDQLRRPDSSNSERN